MKTNSSDEHHRNAESPRRETREPASNVKVESFSQPVKQSSEIIPTDDGRQIDRSEVQLSNADSSRIETRQPDSNAKYERESQFIKHPLEMLSIEEGIQIY
jgi:hypothetical protein